MNFRSAWATSQDFPLPHLNLKVYFMWMCVFLCEFMCIICVQECVEAREGVGFFGTVL